MEIQRHRGLPGGRAVAGGVLMALAVLGVYVAYDRASARPTAPVVVAAHDLRVGAVLEAEDLDTIEADLPDDTGRGVFASTAGLAGRVVLGPIAEGEIVQAGALTDGPSTPDVQEVAIALPRAQIAVGRLKQGERVDVFATHDDRTSSVVRGAVAVEIDADDGGAITGSREVTIVVAVPSGDAVAALVHALRTGDVTVVRSTFDSASTQDPIVYTDGDAPPAPRDGEPDS